MSEERESLFDDRRWTSGPQYESYLSRNTSAPNAATLRAYIDYTARRGDNVTPLYDAARKIEELETRLAS